ncbi:hypothetical protein [Salinispora arenicola]|uniref:hypothetical protein n=1 Tax=Salinispora arenicola TaxID=168697 RepID=UPI0016A88FF1|nr:hypothetical protein [Salinispora arenicola]NIL64665.1 hypothetical protein [Salinispora arenicola]
MYGIARVDPDNVAVPAEEHVMCLDGNPPRLHAGVRFRDALLQLTDGLFDNLYPKHPDFDPDRSRVAVRPGDLRVVLEEATKAAEAGVGGRTEVERGRRAVLRRIAHPLRLGEMSSEAHFTLIDDCGSGSTSGRCSNDSAPTCRFPACGDGSRIRSCVVPTGPCRTCDRRVRAA